MVDDEKNIYELFCKEGYYPIDLGNVDFKQKVKCIDDEGYIIYPSIRNIREHKKPLRFHANNPSTIDNIKHYININNIDVILVSDEYIDSHSNLIFRCPCARLFEASWTNFYYKNKRKCNECTLGKPTHSTPYEDVIELVCRANLIPLFTKENYTNIGSGSAIVQNSFGYKAILTHEFVEYGKIPEWFHVSNPYTPYNINVFLSLTTNGEYECISTCYTGNKGDLEILHKACGKTFHTSWSNLNRQASKKEPNRHGTRCPDCTGLRSQSLHAVVLKQLFLKLREGTITEDKSCRNPITNCIMPTDIVNHNEKIAIEIQSWFHDFPDQQLKDKIKKEYWENLGYTVYTPDIRDYTVLSMAQLFFPELTEIPDWVNYNFEEKLDIDMAQSLLNQGFLVSEVARKMQKSTGSIYSAIHDNRLRYPENYKNKHLIKNKYLYQQTTVQTAG